MTLRLQSFARLVLPALLLGCDTSSQGAVPIADAATSMDASTGGETSSDGASATPQSQSEWLLHMREEEKLARDVYRALKQASPAFSNIAASEQQHMDAVARLLSRYQLSDPVAGFAEGAFATPTFQQLYTELVAKGSASVAAALEVGATIEDLDLADLDEALAASPDADVQQVFGNLAKGSRNHLRSFVSQLSALGEGYSPQYIDEETFQSIVNSPIEAGPNFQRTHGLGRQRGATQ